MLPFYFIKKIPPLEKNLYSMYMNRANQIAPKILPFFSKKDHVLDLGSGTGVISKVIQQKTGCRVTLADVQFNSICNQFPIIIYDGKKLPFANNHFSKTLIMAVLHHCSDPMKVLDEAVRVTSNDIIVMEDVFSGVLSRTLTFTGDCLVNWEIHSPFKNHTKEKWIEIFQKKNLKVKHVEEFRLMCIGFPFKLAIFVLSKNKR